MRNQLNKIVRSTLCIATSLWIAAASSVALADGQVLGSSAIRTLSGTALVMYTITSNTRREIYTAKVITENLSTGARSVQCTLYLGGGTWVDHANATMGPGESQTLTMMVHKNSTIDAGGNLHCRVFSAATSGVTAAWVKVHTEPG